jgi:hypothetical protein
MLHVVSLLGLLAIGEAATRRVPQAPELLYVGASSGQTLYPFDVTTYGAKGDGKVDDTKGFRDAFAAAGINGLYRSLLYILGYACGESQLTNVACRRHRICTARPFPSNRNYIDF